MKLQKTAFALTSLFAIGLFSLNLTGDPTGKTGFFGNTVSSSCRNCHSSGVGGSATLTMNIPAQGFTPGQTYQGILTVSKPGAALFGLNLAAQTASNTNMGTLVSGNTRTQVLQSQLTHRRNGGLFNDSCQFSFNWTAPALASGPVIFKWNGLSANNNGFDTGDFTANGSQTFALAPNASNEMNKGIFEIYPNPTTELINFKRFTVDKAETIEVVNLEGKLVYRTTLLPGMDTVQISTVPWSKGIYLVKYNDFHQKIEVK